MHSTNKVESSLACATRAVILLCTLLCAHTLYSQSADPGSLSVSGTVINSVTHEPVGRALVYASDGSIATFTDEHGKFELSLAGMVPAGASTGQLAIQASLQARRPGYLSNLGREGFVMITAGQKDITISLVPEALIIGKVKFPSAEAGDQVPLQLYRREIRDGSAQWTPLPGTTTRSDGEFRFADLQAGDYRLFTLENTERDPPANTPDGPVYGFPPRFFAAANDFASSDIIHLKAGQNFVATLAPERQKYFDVKIPVMFPEPLRAGLRVSVFPQGHRGPGFALSFNRAQQAIVGSLPNGTYTVEASSFGPESVSGITQFVVNNGPVIGPPLSLTANPSIEVRMHADSPPPRSANPQPQNPDRNIPLAYVTLHSADAFPNPLGQWPRANPESEEIRGVTPGIYWVQVQAPMGYVASATSGGKNLLTTPLTVPYGVGLPPIDIAIRYDGGEIEATIVGDKQQASAAQSPPGMAMYQRNVGSPDQQRSTLYCISAGNTGYPPITPHSWVNGHPTLSNVPPGDYRIFALATPEDMEYRNPEAMRKYESLGQVVHVESGQKLQVNVPLVKE